MRIVIKVGTSTLTHPSGHLNIRRVAQLFQVISDIKNAGHEVILVSSGAIGMGTAVHSGVTGVFSFVALCVAPLNLVKGAVVSLLTMLLYKRVAGPLFRIHE